MCSKISDLTILTTLAVTKKLENLAAMLKVLKSEIYIVHAELEQKIEDIQTKLKPETPP